MSVDGAMSVLPSAGSVSVLIPLYNRAWCIGDCLESIGGLAGLPAEVIVVDDGSTDGSAACARAKAAELGLQDRITVLTQPNGGPGAARNRAAAEAKGEWLVFLDSDDLWLPWTLEVLVKALGEAAPETELAFFNIQTFVDPAELAPEGQEKTVVSDQPAFLVAVGAHTRIRYGTCNAAVRRSAFARVGGFSASLRCAEDTDLFLRVAGPTRIIAQPVLAGLRRSGQDSLTGNAPSVIEGFSWMVTANENGRYPGAPDNRRAFLAGSCAYSIRMAFGTGRPDLAYRLYFRNLALLCNRRTRKYVWRLPLTPLLHLRNPQGYPFRFRPARKG